MQHSLGNTEGLTMLHSLSLVAAKLWFRKTLSWCKKYWQILVGAAIPILVMIIFRNKQSLQKVLREANENHEREIDVLNKSYEKEISDREAASQRYRETLKEIEEKYKEDSKSLDRKKKKEIESLLSDTSKSPEEITKRLSEITGFSIHVSE